MGLPRYSRSKFGQPTSQPVFHTGVFNPPAHVGTTFAGPTPLNSGVRFSVEGTADIAIGPNASVGTSGENAGYILDGEVFIDIDDLEKVFVMGSGAGSTLNYIAS